MRKILAVFLSAILVFTISFGTTISVYAGDSDPRIVVSSANADSGETKEITIAFENSPGVAAVKLDVAFPSDLTLVSFGTDPDPESGENAKLWVNYNLDGIVQQPSASTSPVTLNWVSLGVASGDFVFATLKFKVADNTTGGDKNITVTYGEGDICNSEENDVDFEIVNGKISVPYPKIVVSSEVAARGDTKDITISFRNSPAISSARLNVAFPSDLTLVSLGDDTTPNGNNVTDPDPESGENAKLWVNYNVQSINGFGQQPPTSASPVTLTWVSLGVASGDFVFATLKFKVDDGATIGDKNITVTYDADDIIDIDENDVDFEITNGKIEVVACAHSFVNVASPTYLVTAGDCTHKAVYYKSCSNCGAASTETFEGEFDPTNHVGTTHVVPAEASTCIHQGHGAYTVCDECNSIIFGSDEAFPLDGHTYVEKAEAKYLVSAATCNKKAVYYKSCSVCGEKSTETFEYGEFDTTAHILGAWENDALSHWKTCSVCAEKFENGAHIESDWIIDTPAGIGVAGSRHKECTVCGRVLASETIPALAQPRIIAENKTAKAGGTVVVSLLLENNPGIVNLVVSVGYDQSVLTLTGVEDGGIICQPNNSPTFTANPYKLSWKDDVSTVNYTGNGTLVKLTFSVASAAPEGKYDITLSFNNGDACDVEMNDVPMAVTSGSVTVRNVIIGDVTGDGKVKLNDVTMIKKYIAGGYGVVIDESLADVTGDGKVKLNDVTKIKKYIAGGYGVTLD